MEWTFRLRHGWQEPPCSWSSGFMAISRASIWQTRRPNSTKVGKSRLICPSDVWKSRRGFVATAACGSSLRVNHGRRGRAAVGAAHRQHRRQGHAVDRPAGRCWSGVPTFQHTVLEVFQDSFSINSQYPRGLSGPHLLGKRRMRCCGVYEVRNHVGRHYDKFQTRGAGGSLGVIESKTGFRAVRPAARPPRRGHRHCQSWSG